MAVLLLLILAGFLSVSRSQLELDDRFLEYRQQGMWLVEFYAPWCGYCKKLEPIFKEVDRELKQIESPVKVAKLDCTKYSHIATEFSIKGFPTILFIQGDRVFAHRGDRTKEQILEFALRAQGPTVRQLSDAGKFDEVLKKHKDSVFFLYLGNHDEPNDLFQMYSSAADAYAVYSYFYYGDKGITEFQNLNIQRYPTVLVFKDKRFYEYESTNGTATELSLKLFVHRERYSTFPKMSGGGINELANVAQFLVLLAVEPQQLSDPSSVSSRLFHVVEEVAFGPRDKFHSQFQFLWMDNMEVVNSIAMTFLTAPVLMVMRTGELLYYLNPSATNLTVTSLADYLTSVAEGKEEAHGGTGLLMRLKGILYEMVSFIINIWQTSRWLFFIMLGLPTMVISFICYSLCCMDTADNISDYDDDEENEDEIQRLDDTSLPPIVPWRGELPPYGGVGDGPLKSENIKKNE